MECPNCEQDYDSSLRSPRILPYCGHSLCFLCLKTLWRQRQILCPQCGKSSSADTYDLFPINHSLIQLQFRASLTGFLCQKHGKNIEAFCAQEKDLLCVVCLLDEEHKNHEVQAVNKAAEQEREMLAVVAVKVVQLEQEAGLAEEKIEKAKEALREELNKTKQSLGKVFDLVRDVVDDRQAEVNRKLDSDFDEAISNFNTRLEEIAKQQFLLQALKAEISKTEDESDFELLLKSRDREIVSKAAISPIKSMFLTKALASNSREGELNTVWRQVRERFLQNYDKQSPLRQAVPVSILSLDQGKNGVMKQGKNPLAASADENTFKRMKKGERKLSPGPSTNLKVPVPITSRKQNSPQPSTSKPIASKPRKSTGITTPKLIKTPPKGDFSEEMDETPIHTQTVDLSSYLRQPAAFIYVYGGFSESVSVVVRYDCRGDLWEGMKAQCSRTLGGGVKWGEGVMVLGGKVAGKRVATGEVFPTAGEGTSTAPVTLRAARSGFSLLHINSSLFLFGGSDGSPLKTAEFWDGHHWHDLPSMSQRRDELAAVHAADGCIYVLGGYGGGDMTCQATCERLESDMKTWRPVSSMNTPRRALGAVSVGNSIVAIGGYDGAKYLNTVERLDMQTGKWSYMRSMSTARCAFAAVVSPDQKYIYAVGGFNGTALSEVERYSVSEDTWTRVTPLPMARFMHVAVLLPYSSAVH